VGEIVINGSLEDRLPGNLNVSFPGVDAEALVVRLKEIVAFSTGAACSSAKVEPSHVIMALAQNNDRAFSSVRFGVGRNNTEEEIRIVAQAISSEVGILRKLGHRKR
jgi:cysteine desulfurase